jgi:hypothetical protein
MSSFSIGDMVQVVRHETHDWFDRSESARAPVGTFGTVIDIEEDVAEFAAEDCIPYQILTIRVEHPYVQYYTMLDTEVEYVKPDTKPDDYEACDICNHDHAYDFPYLTDHELNACHSLHRSNEYGN